MTAATKTAPAVTPLHIVNARVTYRNAPIHLLEKFTFKDVDGAHRAFLKDAGFEECIILQTCNRVEVYAAAKEPDEAKLLEEWASSVGLQEKDFSNVELSRGRDAVLHLMKLTSGLDSLVVGEDQILGQVRRALEFSRSGRYASANLSLVFDRALRVGSRVRTATGINRGNGRFSGGRHGSSWRCGGGCLLHHLLGHGHGVLWLAFDNTYLAFTFGHFQFGNI